MNRYRRRWYWIPGVVATVVVVALVNYHFEKLGIGSEWHVWINATAFFSLVFQLFLAHVNTDFEATEGSHPRKIGVVVPVYNEDPGVFRAMLDSLSAQTRRPDLVYVVDDGSQTSDCRAAFDEWVSDEIPAKFHRQENAGKREAQAVAFRDTPDIDIYCTVDSDTVLEDTAIENGIKPFLADARVQAVAGFLLGLNWNKNLLTRLVDVGFVTSFLSGRAAWSRARSVSVNCGGLAFYRGTTVRKHLDEYVNQTVFGRRVACGDDRILTNLCLLEGWTVFQESSRGFTMHPERLSHLTRQRVRWWRSFFFGSEWLLRRFPESRLVWWLVLGQLADFFLFTTMLVSVVPYALIVGPARTGDLPVLLVLYLAGLGYLRNIRYLSVRRPDQGLLGQFGLWLLSPLAVVLNVFLCTILQYVGLVTVHKTGWSTRKKVEVSLEPTPTPPV